MKNIFKAVLILLSSATILSGCTREPNTTEAIVENPLYLVNIPESFSIIGAEHNNGLEYAFQEIREHYQIATRNGEVVKLTKEELFELGERATADFCAENQLFGANQALLQKAMSIPDVNGSPMTRTEVDGYEYSQTFISFLNELNQIIANALNGSKEQFKSDIESLVLKAQSSLNETELAGFYAGAGTSFASMIYWIENYHKWMVALNNPELLSEYTDEELNGLEQVATRSLFGDIWDYAWDTADREITAWWNGGGKEVVVADGAGAASGAILGATGGAVIGGVGAGPGALAGGVAGGVGASIEETIKVLAQ